MPELRVVAVSNDGTRLVLKAADGTEFSLAIDERLRAAVRGDRARLGQIEIEVESQLRPRDIQARIRAGATAEEVAQLAGIPVDRVRRFEGPVLAERAFMAERARKTPIRRQGEAAGPLLGEIVTERLHLRGADSESVQWDSWRRDDGSWEVLLLYRVDGEMHSASWSFDPPRRLVTTNDDEARSLVGEQGAETPFPFRPRPASLPRNTGDDAITSLLDAVPGLRGESAAAAAGPREPVRIDVPAIGGERTRPGPATIRSRCPTRTSPKPRGGRRRGRRAVRRRIRLRERPRAPRRRPAPRPPRRRHRPPGRSRRRPTRPPRHSAQLGRDRLRQPPQEARIARISHPAGTRPDPRRQARLRTGGGLFALPGPTAAANADPAAGCPDAGQGHPTVAPRSPLYRRQSPGLLPAGASGALLCPSRLLR
ncbi:septation protein SepH [Yinghuangia aomiensis]